jgi:hypothetical protein
MVKNGQACAVESLSRQSIFGVNYANPKFPKLGVEWLRLSELLGRVSPGHFALPQRPGFHLLMLFTAGSGDHFLDFRRVRCKAGTLVHARPGQVQQFVLGQKLEADILLFTSEFIFPAFSAADGAFGTLIDDIVPEDVMGLRPDALESVGRRLEAFSHYPPAPPLRNASDDRRLLRQVRRTLHDR